MFSSLAEAAEQVSVFIETCRPQPSTPDRFGALACALFQRQVEHNPVYRRFCEARGITTATDWRTIPAMPTVAFKSLDVTSLPPGERTAVFHSSGTTAHQPGRHFHSAASLALYEQSLLAWFEPHFPACRESRIISLSPDPAVAPHSSLAHMFSTVSRLGGNGEFLGELEGQGAWTLDVARVMETLRAAAHSDQPVLLLGTAFLYVPLLDALKSRGERLPLPPGSVLFETGGYKGRSRELPKAELYAALADRFGVSEDRIVSEYGMSELSSQAYDRVAGQAGGRIFRFPPWARVVVVSPEDGREVSEGDCGLIRLFDLANVYSVMAIQTEDLGIRRGDGVELVGRASGAEARGCSLLTL